MAKTQESTEKPSTPDIYVQGVVRALRRTHGTGDGHVLPRSWTPDDYNASLTTVAIRLGTIAIKGANLNETVLDPETSDYTLPNTNNQDNILSTIENLSPKQIYDTVMSLSGHAVSWQVRLDQIRESAQSKTLSKIQKAEFVVLRNRMCSYNKLIKEFIDVFGLNEQFTYRNVINAMVSAAKINNGSLDNEKIFNTLKSIIVGARTELLFETQIQNSDFKKIPTTIQQDLDGIDFVLDDGKKRICVDIKSSKVGVHGKEKIRNCPNLPAYRHRYSQKSGKIFVLWPYVSHEQFGDRIAPPFIPEADRQVLDVLQNVA